MKNSQRPELLILGPIIILLILSQVVLRSVFPIESQKNLISAFIALAAFLLISRIDHKQYLQFSGVVYVMSIILLLITFVFGAPTRGSVRWLQIGSTSLQTSELIKPLMILSLASFALKLDLSQLKDLSIYLFLLLIPVGLVFFQPDLGSALVLLVIGISIAFVAGMKTKIIVFSTLLFTILTPVLYRILKPYQQERIMAFADPFSDPLGSGYSVIQSMIAIGSGKILGRGLGHGTQSQLRFIPERHSDFIFASVGEELGFVGVLIILVCYLVLLQQILNIASRSSDEYGSLIAVGVFSLIFFQLAVNIGMNIGIIPVTGITLPLISSGGSSLLTIMICLGFAQSVSRRKKPRQTIEIH